MRRVLIGLILALFAPFVLAVPADGNGNKIVFSDSGSDMIDCDFDGSGDLTLYWEGWVQIKTFGPPKNPNVELNVFHFDSVYTNAQGETWTWRDRGPDRYFEVVNDDGELELHMAISGRSGWNVIGHAIINWATGEFVFATGHQPFGGDIGVNTPDDFACEMLF